MKLILSFITNNRQQPSAVVGSVNGGDWEPLKDVDNFANGLLNFLGSL